MNNIENGIDNGSVYHFKVKNEKKGNNYKRWIKKNIMLLSTLGAVVLGITLGISLRPLNLSKDTIMLISYPGELFMRILKLMILPLVIASLITGCASINVKMNGKIAFKTFVYFVLTSLLNAILGAFFVILIHPGSPEMRSNTEVIAKEKNNNLMDSLTDIGR
jgi:Na+/H+-dicarboxylate symporter